jgi:hypothetical protein
MGREFWIGLGIAIISVAIGLVITIATAVGMITKENTLLWILLAALLFLIGIGIIVWSLCCKKDKREPAISSKQPIRLIPKRKIKRIVHRTEVIDGKTKYTEEIELDP